MNIKSFHNLKTDIAIALTSSFILVFILSLNSLAQTQPKSEILTLTVKLENRYNPDFKLCLPIETNVPIEISWTKGEIKSSISAVLYKPEGEVYRIKFTHTEGTAEKTIYSGMVEPKLKLEEPFEETFIASLAFKNFYTQSLLLSKGACGK